MPIRRTFHSQALSVCKASRPPGPCKKTRLGCEIGAPGLKPSTTRDVFASLLGFPELQQVHIHRLGVTPRKSWAELLRRRSGQAGRHRRVAARQLGSAGPRRNRQASRLLRHRPDARAKSCHGVDHMQKNDEKQASKQGARYPRGINVIKSARSPPQMLLLHPFAVSWLAPRPRDKKTRAIHGRLCKLDSLNWACTVHGGNIQASQTAQGTHVRASKQPPLVNFMRTPRRASLGAI